ncbi:MAG: NADH-quinone oxidoreductase subunit H [Bacteroidetes bacterium]|nr:NADH-quinone oxidoreductase subunit H [Bacteroidota bacterium]MCA0448052.1 NADH-quinone oxidoreductase subunit H [Bacteroidota bacterium]
MDLSVSLQGLFPFVLILLVSPFLVGLINKQKAILTGRIGAPVWQPYYDLARLSRKETIYATSASFISRIAPVISFSAILFTLLILPIGYVRPLFSFNGDIIVFAYLLGLARFFQILGAMDIGSSFEGMGAAREATFAVFAEPIFFFTLGSLAFISGHTSIYDIYHSIQLDEPSALVFIIVSSISGFILLVTECSRMPIDDPNTHLELTMIHEVMILDNSGIDLFLYQYGSYIKIMVYAVFEASFFNPFSMANEWLGFSVFIVVIFLLTTVIAWVETMIARFKMKSIPQYLLFATAIGILNLLIYTFVR